MPATPRTTKIWASVVRQDRPELRLSADEPVQPRGFRNHLDEGRRGSGAQGLEVDLPIPHRTPRELEEGNSVPERLEHNPDGLLVHASSILDSDGLRLHAVSQPKRGVLPRLREVVHLAPLADPFHVARAFPDELVREERAEVLT